jgi:hypothetical protein
MAKILNFENILHSQVLVACRGYPEFEFALYNPANTWEGICAQLRNYINISSYSKRSYLQDFNSQYLQRGQQDSQDQLTQSREHENYQEADTFNPEDPHSAFLYDRKFSSSRRQQNSGYAPKQFGSGQRGNNSKHGFSSLGRCGDFPRNQNFRIHYKHSNKICYVCKQKGCWSSNHPIAERKAAFAEFKEANSNRYKSVEDKQILYNFLVEIDKTEFSDLVNVPNYFDKSMEIYLQEDNPSERLQYLFAILHSN